MARLLKLGWLLLSLPVWLVSASLINQASSLANLLGLGLLIAYPALGCRLFLQDWLLDLRYRLLLEQAERSRAELARLEADTLSERQAREHLTHDNFDQSANDGTL